MGVFLFFAFCLLPSALSYLPLLPIIPFTFFSGPIRTLGWRPAYRGVLPGGMNVAPGQQMLRLGITPKRTVVAWREHLYGFGTSRTLVRGIGLRHKS